MSIKEILSDDANGRYPNFQQFGTCDFDNGFSLVSDIKERITDYGTCGGSISLGAKYGLKHTNSGDICAGVEYTLTVNTAENKGTYNGIPITAYFPNKIKAEIRWMPYTEPPPPPTTPPPTVPDPVYPIQDPISLTPPEIPLPPSIPIEFEPPVIQNPEPDPPTPPQITWVDQQIILQKGFKVPFADYNDINKCGREESEDDIINPLIPDRERAERIAKIKIWTSYKDRNITLDGPPNFLIKPLSFEGINISALPLKKTEKVRKISIFDGEDSQYFKITADINTREQ